MVSDVIPTSQRKETVAKICSKWPCVTSASPTAALEKRGVKATKVYAFGDRGRVSNCNGAVGMILLYSKWTFFLFEFLVVSVIDDVDVFGVVVSVRDSKLIFLAIVS